MVRFICFVLVFFTAVVFYFNSSNSLVSFALNNSKKIEVLNCDFDDNCFTFNESRLDDFVDLIDLEISNEFFIGNGKIIEGYSRLFCEYVLINNMKINIQISISDNVCLVGSPLIKNSF